MAIQKEGQIQSPNQIRSAYSHPYFPSRTRPMAGAPNPRRPHADKSRLHVSGGAPGSRPRSPAACFTGLPCAHRPATDPPLARSSRELFAFHRTANTCCPAQFPPGLLHRPPVCETVPAVHCGDTSPYGPDRVRTESHRVGSMIRCPDL